MRKWLVLAGVVVLALALVIGVKTLTMPSRQVAATHLKRFHGTNERISTANAVEMIQFYHQLIGNASSADTSQDRSLP